MRRLTLAALLGVATLTAGCVTLLPKSAPADLYRFSFAAAASPPTPVANRIGVIEAPIEFDRAAQTDGILTMTGGAAAYIADARWVAPASTLFDDAVDEAFADGPVLLLSGAKLGQAGHTLRLSVRRFEADYPSEGAAPSVIVEIDADIVRNTDRALIAQRRFSATSPAAENRISAIVPAFDAALAQALPQLVQWTDQTVRGDQVK